MATSMQTTKYQVHKNAQNFDGAHQNNNLKCF